MPKDTGHMQVASGAPPGAKPLLARPRLSAFWFCYMGGLGIFFPYYSLYLRRELSLSGTQIGLVMAALPLAALIAQPLWGYAADRTGSRRLVLVLLTAGTSLAWLGLGLPAGFAGAVLGTAVMAMFSEAVQPVATAVTMAGVSRHGNSSYGGVRMWGTAGFLVLVVVFPWLLPPLKTAVHSGPWQGLGLMFPAAAVLGLVAAMLATRLPWSPALTLRSARGDSRRLLRHGPMLRLLVVVFIAYLFMVAPITLFPLYVTDRGGDLDVIGQMWIFMLLLEIPLIGLSSHALRRIGARGLLTVGLVAEGLRWSVCAISTDLAVIRAVQLLHGVRVAGILIGAQLYVEQAAPESLRSTGQALTVAAGAGAGALVSNVAGGWLFDHLGGNAPYMAAGAGALMLGLVLHWVLPAPHRPSTGTVQA